MAERERESGGGGGGSVGEIKWNNRNGEDEVFKVLSVQNGLALTWQPTWMHFLRNFHMNDKECTLARALAVDSDIMKNTDFT